MPLSTAQEVLLFVACFVASVWPALFVLAWRDARRRPAVILKPEESAATAEMTPRMKLADLLRWQALIVVPLHAAVFFLVWPGLVGSRLGRRNTPSR